MARGEVRIGNWPSRPRRPQEAYQQAVALQQRGRFDEAAELYDTVLKVNRNHFESLHNLGVIRFQQGRVEEAMRLLRRALMQNPRAADPHNSIANALQKSGRLKEAVGHYERALALDPHHVQAHSNLGLALLALNRSEEAVHHFEQALARDPQQPKVHSNLGIALLSLNRNHAGVAHLERALQFNPDDRNARSFVARCLLRIGWHEAALAHYTKILALSPDDFEAHTGAGQALGRLGRTAAARQAFERAITLKPDHAEAYVGLGVALETDGRIDEALQAFERAVALAPRQARYYRAITEAKRFAPDDPHLAAMEELARDAGPLPESEQIELHFALGKALDDVGRRPASFGHFLAGNALKRKSIRYDEAAVLADLARLQTVYTAAFMRDMAGLGDPSSVPVFIVGMPRSGTTLVEQIVASHPAVFGAGEREDFALLANRDFPELAAPVPVITDAVLRRLAAAYVAAIGRDATPGAARITDKMPANFVHAGLIHLALPNARIIHTRRDPVDTCLSIFSKLFSGNLPYTYDLGELGRYYRAYERLMAHWRQVLPAGVMIEVQYEEVVADLEGQARRIVAHCGLDWDEACLAFHQTERPVLTASKSQVRQPIFTSSIGRWRAYGALLDPLLEALGIERLTAPAA